ncbi:Leucyl aminopeptidase yscIV [Lunasporangiospora selenospora]|uniref:Peptide hydrolase n=1 Tax=Lunasporangiospora selenospora TaxID=979761 RepID=A0A9P6G3L6_9FUNG|nr:Leucyl aminopeptidase yscIV [Lunasporangiospora selenospora]
MNHLQELDKIAREHSNSRSVVNGFNASADYVRDQLLAGAAGYCDVSIQEFKVPVWKELEIPEFSSVLNLPGSTPQERVEYQHMNDFRVFQDGGPSTTLRKQRIRFVPNHGCKLKDHSQIAGKVAIIEARGEDGLQCDYWIAARNAEKAGASGVIFYNTAKQVALIYTRMRVIPWKEGDPLISIPVLSVSYSIGTNLVQHESTLLIDIRTRNSQTVETTRNVLCTTKDGNDQDTIVVGSHLDSVPDGPGMVDNGSGSSVNLEMALLMAKYRFSLKSRIVFAWWGAEEIGLLGSRHYVRQLVAEGKKQEVVHNGTTAPESLIQPSVKIQDLFLQYFSVYRHDYELTDMFSGSDFIPFLLEGIPAGGLLTGADEQKSVEQRKRFGGFAGAPLDPCYHQSCDNIDNVSKEAIQTMSQAALYVVTKLAKAKNLRGWLYDESWSFRIL